MSGPLRAIALVIVVVLSSVAFAGAGTSAALHDEPQTGEVPPDPEDDAIGWECGYWHNESIDASQSDGLDDEELDAVVCRTMARVEHVRGLEFEETVPVSVQSREAYREEVQNRSVDPTLRRFDNAKFEALFLIDQTTDSIEIQNRNSGASVLGYYSTSSDEIVLVAPNESAVQVDEYTLAHELVHALQDQHFNLSRNRGETRDEVNARSGLVEGEARYVEHRYREAHCLDPEHAWNGTCMTPAEDGDGSGELANIGVYFLKYQPYSDGPAFVSSLRSTGGWEAVDAAYDNPPASAEQVIHPEKYPAEAPATVNLTDRTADEWERVRPPGRPDYGEMGQTGIASMIVFPMYDGGTPIVDPQTWLNYTGPNQVSTFDPLNYGFESAEGWAGDRLHVYRNDQNETAYVWRIEWDSRGDAREFLVDYEQVLQYWGGEEIRPATYRLDESAYGDAIRVIHDNETVTIVSAPTIDDLPAVRNGSLPPANATVDENASRTDSGDVTTTEWPDLRPPTQPGFGPIVTVIALLAGIAALASRRN